MRTYGIPFATLSKAAAAIGAQLYNVREEARDRHKRESWAFVLRPKTDLRFRRRQHGLNTAGRRVWAICWHGHREFMARCFAEFPFARIKTSKSDYRSEDQFYRAHDGTRTGPHEREPFDLACDCTDERSDASEIWEHRPAFLEAPDALPLCVQAMGCLCAGHARGAAVSAACDTTE